MYNRRNLLRFAGAVAALPLLQACGSVLNPSPTPGPNTDLTKAQSIVSAIAGAVPMLLQTLTGATVGISPTVAARWQNLAAQVTKAAADVMSAVSTSAGSGAMSVFGNAVNALLSDLVQSSGLLPARAQSIMAEIQTVLPIALGIFQVVLAVASPMRAQMASPADVDAALLDLHAFAQTGK